MPTTKLSDPIALRIPSDILADIEKVAASCERSRSWVMVRAMKAYLAAEGADILAIEKGREQIEAGQSHDLEEVLDALDAEDRESAAA